MSTRVNKEEQEILDKYSMPIMWLQVMAHPTTKDKAQLLHRLKYEMTIGDVYDLAEYQSYEDWIAWETEKLKETK